MKTKLTQVLYAIQVMHKLLTPTKETMKNLKVSE